MPRPTPIGTRHEYLRRPARACVKATLVLGLVWPEKTLIASSWGKLLLLVWSHASQQELLERPQPAKNATLYRMVREDRFKSSPQWEGENFYGILWSACWPFDSRKHTCGHRLPSSQDPDEAPVDCQSSPAPPRLDTEVTELDCGCLYPRRPGRWAMFSAVPGRWPHASSSTAAKTLPARLPVCQGLSWRGVRNRPLGSWTRTSMAWCIGTSLGTSGNHLLGSTLGILFATKMTMLRLIVPG